MSVLSKKIGIDPGTSTLRAYVKGEDVFNEPSHAADRAVTAEMLQHLIGKVQGRIRMFRPEVMISVPAGAPSPARRAVTEAAMSAGARQVWLIDKPLAAAIGAGLPIHESRGVAVCDIGGATTEVAVISLSGMVVARSIAVGGKRFDEAIAAHLQMDVTAAERLKVAIGAALPLDEPLREGEITSNDIAAAVAEPLQLIVAAIRDLLAEAPTRLAADVADRGIVLTGGGAQLRGLDRYIAMHAGIPCALAENPQNSVVRGTGLALENFEVLKRNQAYLR
ncbi:MAG TPA: rod shape-determining protein [Candidatus Dormibacteraeota bacterium]|nr:rod shape-determining protein [Candidatus Dormibacteraeota bacterium]